MYFFNSNLILFLVDENLPKPKLFLKKLSDLLPSAIDVDIDDICFEFPLKTEEAMLNLEERIKDDTTLQFKMV